MDTLIIMVVVVMVVVDDDVVMMGWSYFLFLYPLYNRFL